MPTTSPRLVDRRRGAVRLRLSVYRQRRKRANLARHRVPNRRQKLQYLRRHAGRIVPLRLGPARDLAVLVHAGAVAVVSAERRQLVHVPGMPDEREARVAGAAVVGQKRVTAPTRALAQADPYATSRRCPKRTRDRSRPATRPRCSGRPACPRSVTFPSRHSAACIVVLPDKERRAHRPAAPVDRIRGAVRSAERRQDGDGVSAARARSGPRLGFGTTVAAPGRPTTNSRQRRAAQRCEAQLDLSRKPPA